MRKAELSQLTNKRAPTASTPVGSNDASSKIMENISYLNKTCKCNENSIFKPYLKISTSNKPFSNLNSFICNLRQSFFLSFKLPLLFFVDSDIHILKFHIFLLPLILLVLTYAEKERLIDHLKAQGQNTESLISSLRENNGSFQIYSSNSYLITKEEVKTVLYAFSYPKQAKKETNFTTENLNEIESA